MKTVRVDGITYVDKSLPNIYKSELHKHLHERGVSFGHLDEAIDLLKIKMNLSDIGHTGPVHHASDERLAVLKAARPEMFDGTKERKARQRLGAMGVDL